MALGIFTHLCLVLLLPLAGSSEISLSINKKKLERSPGKGRYNLSDGLTALAQLYVLYSQRGSRWGDGFYGYRLKFWPISG